ncbi:hypothetical protein SESBI_25576 [Sesbania bispinosa]|nr:hypothetical protein SESBI_25576 [Sesbania bispinosa]
MRPLRQLSLRCLTDKASMALVSVGFHKVADLCGRRENWRGVCIEAVVQKHLIHRFSHSAVEGDVYNLTNFTVTSKRRMVLSLIKSSEILKTKGSSQYLIDFMGIVTGISEELNFSKEGRQTRLMLIDMVDEMYFQPSMVQGKAKLARVNLYRGEVGIQNLFNASKLFWNPEILEAIEFKNGLVVHEIETNVAISLISDNGRPICIREQFLKLYSRRRVGKLNHLLEDGTYIVHGTITEIFQDESWWYLACSCMRAVDFSQGFPYCDGCKCEVFDMTLRYKVKFLLSDKTDSTELVMFDSECYSLINISCKRLAKQVEGYPDEILELIGQDLLFRVEHSEDQDDAFDGESFKVRKICFDPSIIEDYKELIEDETPLKFEENAGTSCVIDLTPNTITIGSEPDISTPSGGQSSSTPPASTAILKPSVKGKDDEPSEKKKKGQG